MDNWRKKINNDGSIVFEYGDGEGDLLYRLYCVESEDNIDGMVPHVFFYGDSALPNPSIEDVKTVIELENLYDCEVVVCSVTEQCNDPDCKEVFVINGECYWKI